MDARAHVALRIPSGGRALWPGALRIFSVLARKNTGARYTGNKAAVTSIIGPELTVTGDLISDGEILVDGRIEGHIKTHALTIGEGGTIKGVVTAGEVLVAGTMNGKIRAKTVSLASTARIQGYAWQDNLAGSGHARSSGHARRRHMALAALFLGVVAFSIYASVVYLSYSARLAARTAYERAMAEQDVAAPAPRDSYRDFLSALLHPLATLANARLESQRELAALRERNAKLGLEMARLEHELAHSRTERDRFSSVEEALTRRRERLESELADMHRRNEATTTQLENLEQKLVDLAAERDKVGLERAALASHVGELEQHLDSLQSDQKVLVSRLKEGTTSNAIAVERALVLSIIHHESAFNPMAISRKGALGLMQLMPMTARQTADGLGLDYASRRLTEDPDYNIRLGSAYLGQLLDNFDGNYVLALAAYNAGTTRVRKWLRANGDPRSPEVDAFDWIEMIPYEETRNFVQGVLDSLQLYREPLGGTRADVSFLRETGDSNGPEPAVNAP
jgi:soluble lytic murein transglycosylase-like protein